MEKRQIFLESILLTAVLGLGAFANVKEVRAGNTYYVCDTAGTGTGCNAGAGSGWSTGDDNNNATQAQSKSSPWKTIQKCADSVSQPGDKCVVGDGVYVDKGGIYNAIGSNPGCSHLPGGKPHWTTVYLKYKSGQPGNKGVGLAGIQNYDPDTWITFIAENEHGAILDSNKSTGNEAMGWCIDDSIFAFTIYDSDYIRVEGFEIREYARAGIGTIGKSNHIHFLNNVIHDIGYWCWVPPADSKPTWNAWQYGNGSAVGVQQRSGDSHLLLDNNLIYKTGRLHIGQNGCDHYPGFSPESCDSNPVCAQMKANGYTPQMDYSHRDHWFYPGGVQNVIFSNNIHYNNTGHDDITMSNLNIHFDTFYIFNNTFYDGESEEGLKFIGSNGYGHVPGYIDFGGDSNLYNNIKIYNNILYSTEKFWNNHGPSLVNVRGYGNIENIEVNNNLVFSPIRESHTLFYSTNLQEVYNNGNWRDFALSGNIHNQDPLFSDRVNHDFTPALESPVCNGGVGGSYIGAIPCLVPADVNSDGKVNIKDIQAVIRCIINLQSCEFPDQSDVNGDSSVNIKDIQEIIKVIVTN